MLTLFSLLTVAKVTRFLPRKIFLDNSMLTLKLFSLLTVVKVINKMIGRIFLLTLTVTIPLTGEYHIIIFRFLI